MTPTRFVRSIRPIAHSAKRHIRAGMDALRRPRVEKQLAEQAQQPNRTQAQQPSQTQAQRRERFINMSLARRNRPQDIDTELANVMVHRAPAESTEGPVSHMDFQVIDQFRAPDSHALIEGFKQAFNACLRKDRPQLNTSGDMTPGSKHWCDAVASRIATGEDIEQLVADLLEQYRAADGQNDRFILWLEHQQEQVQNDVRFWWGEAQSHATAMRRAGYPF